MVSPIAGQNSKRRLLILPGRALKYFGISVLTILLVLLCLDKLILPFMEQRADLSSSQWQQHNNRVNEMMGQRNLASGDNPVWRSAFFPVSEQPHLKRRILVMGDSYVWGDGQANLNDTWWRQLQYELANRGYNDVEVIAAGRCGYATNVELSWAKKLVKMYKPDAIIFGYITNDPDEGSESPGDGYVKQMKQPPDDSAFNGKMRFFSSCFPHLAYQLKELRNKKLSERASGPEGYLYSTWEMKLLEGKNFEVYKETVRQLGKFVSECNVPVFTVTLPLPVETTREKYVPVEKLFRQSGAPFYDLLDPMLADYKIRKGQGKAYTLTVSPANGHPGFCANKFYAKSCADLLERDYASVIGPRSKKEIENSKIEINDYVPPLIAHSQPKANVFAIYYPKDRSSFLLMPMGRPYIQLNLAHAYAFKEIQIVGKSLKKACLAVRAWDPAKDTEPVIHELGTKKGDACIFKMPQQQWASGIDEIMITAETGQDNQLLVEFVQP